MAKKKVTPRKRAKKENVIEDGQLAMTVNGGEYDGSKITMDLALLRLASQECLALHKLKPVKGAVQPTAQFIASLNGKLKSLGYKSTPAIALHAWIKMSDYFAAIQKKTPQSQS